MRFEAPFLFVSSAAILGTGGLRSVQSMAKIIPLAADGEGDQGLVKPVVLGIWSGSQYQIVGERSQPLVSVVRTLEEALAALGVQSAHFEPLE